MMKLREELGAYMMRMRAFSLGLGLGSRGHGRWIVVRRDKSTGLVEGHRCGRLSQARRLARRLGGRVVHFRKRHWKLQNPWLRGMEHMDPTDLIEDLRVMCGAG